MTKLLNWLEKLYIAPNAEARGLIYAEGEKEVGENFHHFKKIKNEIHEFHPQLMAKSEKIGDSMNKANIPLRLQKELKSAVNEKLLEIPLKEKFMAEHNLTHESLNLNPTAIDKLIESNDRLRGVAENFLSRLGGGANKIFKIGKVTLVVSVAGLTIYNLGKFLHETAIQVSGCYRLSESGECCKLRSRHCDHKSLPATNSSFCMMGETENCDCQDDAQCKNIAGSTTDGGRYVCYRATWVDILQAEVKNVTSLLKTFFHFAKYIVIFIALYFLFSKFQPLPRIGITSLATAGISLVI